MSGSRRIPISSSRPPVAGANRQPHPAWQSSLDLVFSFSRSAAFFGSNLPTSPSFVARYRRPGFPDDEESSATAPSDREAEGRTTSDDGTRGEESIASADEDWSADEIDERALSWDNDAPLSLREQLPRNAISNTNNCRKSSRARAGSQPSTSEAGSFPESQLLQPPPQPKKTERTPLLSRQSSASDDAYNPTTPTQFRRVPLHSAALLSHTNSQKPPLRRASSANRRLSIVSAEIWKEAIEENRGLSTYGQTLFNSVNVLVGVGLLAMPLAFADAGWVLGTILLLFCALITNYTAKMLARLMAKDPSLRTYTDVLIKAFGPRARSFVHLMFVLELGAFSIAVVDLFADSMSTLFPAKSSAFFKILAFFIIFPTTLIPLRFLSITSLLGIMSSFALLLVLIIDGSIKKHSPGSLWSPMPTSAGPRWGRLPLSFGLLMSGFAGHAVIPSLYRDMKDPRHFASMINTAYVIAFSMSLVMGVLGYVMFGNDVSDEVTRDIRRAHGYPLLLNQLAVWMIALNPVVKYALASGPLAATIEHLLGVTSIPPQPEPIDQRILNGSAIASEDSESSLSLPHPHLQNTPMLPPPSPLNRTIRLAIRPLLMILVIILAISIPNFGIILSFLGSSSAFGICAIGPIGAYLILARRGANYKPSREGEVREWSSIGPGERVLCLVLLGISIVLAGVGTVWVFLPVSSQSHGHHFV